MMLRYLAGTSQIAWISEDQTTTRNPVQITVSSFLNKPINLFMSVNMASGNNYMTTGSVYDSTYKVNKFITVGYDSTWKFDSTLEMSVCSDYGGANSIECTIQNLKVKYTADPVDYSIIDFTNTVTMIGDYKLNDDDKLKNSQGTLGSATLSSTPPAWNSDGGLTFSSPIQYMELPNFIPSASDLTITTSVAFTFYIRIYSAPSTTTNIMSYYCTSVSGVVFGVLLSPSLKFQIKQGALTSGGTPSFPLGQWNMVTVSYSYTYGSYGVSVLYLNSQTGPILTAAVSGSSIFSSSDRVRFGEGFVGQIRRIQVYSPAAFRLNYKPCDPTTCNLDVGFSIPPTCLNAVCRISGTYTSFGSCESCPKGCSACTDPTTCQSCHSDYYQDGTTCLKCPQGKYVNSPTSCVDCPSACSSCTDFQTCQSCNSGFGLLDNFCVICPDETFLNNNQICQEFPPALQSTLEKSQLLTSGATQASTILSGGSSVSLSAAVSGRIFSQIKYLNISYAGELQVALRTWLPSFVSLGLTPDMPEGMISKIPNRHVPHIFEKYDVSSSFLINFWESLGIVIFATVLWMLSYGIELIINFQRKPKITSFIRKIRVFTQNFLISTLFGVYGDLVMFSVIDYRTFVFEWNLSLLSFSISLTLLITMSLTFWYQTKLLINYQKIKKQDQTAPADSPKLLRKFIQKHEGSSTIFSEVKDYSIAPQLFLFFLSGRDLLCSLILAALFDFPVTQTFMIIIMDCLMITYLLMKRPFLSNFNLSKQLFFELIGLIVNVCVLINAVLDAEKSKALGIKSNIGKLIIIMNMVFNFATAVFMLISIGQLLLEFYRKHKQKGGKIPLSIKNRSQETQNKSQLDSSNQSFLQESAIINNPPFGNTPLQSESADLSLLPKQIPLSKKPRIPRKTPKRLHDPSLVAHQEIELENKYPSPKQQRLNKENNSMKSLIIYDPTENFNKTPNQSFA